MIVVDLVRNSKQKDTLCQSMKSMNMLSVSSVVSLLYVSPIKVIVLHRKNLDSGLYCESIGAICKESIQTNNC